MERCRRAAQRICKKDLSRMNTYGQRRSLGRSGSIFHKWIERERWEILMEKRGGTCAKDPTSPVGAARLDPKGNLNMLDQVVSIYPKLTHITHFHQRMNSCYRARREFAKREFC